MGSIRTSWWPRCGIHGGRWRVYKLQDFGSRIYKNGMENPEEQVWILKSRSQYLTFSSWGTLEVSMRVISTPVVPMKWDFPPALLALLQPPMFSSARDVAAGLDRHALPLGPPPAPTGSRLQGNGLWLGAHPVRKAEHPAILHYCCRSQPCFPIWLFSVMKCGGLDPYTLAFFVWHSVVSSLGQLICVSW